MVPEEKAQTETVQASVETKEVEMWRDMALRLQASMDNFRKLQRRLAEEKVATERERLLLAFLNVTDNLDRALAARGDIEDVRGGVELTRRGLLQFLRREGVEPMEAEGQPFDPSRHEAVGQVASDGLDVEPGTIVRDVEKGYTVGDRLLRPARVIVAM